jgi:DNA polymerase
MPKTLSLFVAKQYEKHELEWGGCVKCPIGKLAKRRVFVRGTLPCDVLFLGEAPGKAEDVIGEPFVGATGQLLDDLIERAWNRRSLSWAITNVIACRPCDHVGGSNRPPTEQEVRNCEPRLAEIVAIATPRAVVMLGRTAEEEAPAVWAPRKSLRLPHPAFIIRNGGTAGGMFRSTVERLNNFLQEVPCGS